VEKVFWVHYTVGRIHCSSFSTKLSGNNNCQDKKLLDWVGRRHPVTNGLVNEASVLAAAPDRCTILSSRVEFFTQ